MVEDEHLFKNTTGKHENTLLVIYKHQHILYKLIA